MVKSITEENVKKEITKGVVAVDCYAPWCGPCSMLEPIMEDLSSTTNKAAIYKLDVDTSPNLCDEYQIMTVPTVLFFKDGKLAKTSTGVKPKEEYVRIIEELA